jgi:hypothetical protein
VDKLEIRRKVFSEDLKGGTIWATEWWIGGNIFDIRKIRCEGEEWVK